VVFVLGCASTSPSIVEAAPPPKGSVVLPADATPGERDLAKLQKPIAEGVLSQPFGKTYAELQPKSQPPKDKAMIGEADTHEALKADPIEIQAQVQFLEETKIEARYGRVSLRIVRQYRYGKLGAAQIVLERIGRDEKTKAEFDADLAALAAAWKNPTNALGLKTLRLTRNDLFPLQKELPLRVVFEPMLAEGDPK